MKIRFKVSKTGNIDPKTIMGIIQSKLLDKKYTILEVTGNSIRFYDNPWVLRWNFQKIRRLEGGVFDIDNTSLTLKYYLNLWQILIGASISIIWTVVSGVYEATIFFTAFIIIAMCIQTLISRNVAKDMLTSIINESAVV